MMRLGLLLLITCTHGKPAKRLEYFRVPKTGSTWMMYYFTRTRNCSGLALHDHGKGCGDLCDAGRCGDPKSCNASLVGRDAAVLAVARDPVSRFASLYDHMRRNFIVFEPAMAGERAFYDWVRRAVAGCGDTACRVAGIGAAYEAVRQQRAATPEDERGPHWKKLSAAHKVMLYPQDLFVGPAPEVVCYSDDVAGDVNAVLRRYGFDACVVPPPDLSNQRSNTDRKNPSHTAIFTRDEICALYPDDCALFARRCASHQLADVKTRGR